jgi:hypothetical protein
MLVRGIALSLASLLAAGSMVDSALADHKRRHIIIEDDYYEGPPFVRHIPGLRIFFGDYALTEEEFDELYGTGRRAYRRDREDYDPEPAKPRRKSTQQEQQKPAKKTASRPAEGAGSSTKKAPAKAAASSSGLSCERATSVVSGYGFSSVTPSSCNGKVYAFNAQRDGKNFAIKLDPKSGELTEVKKLP